MATIVTMPAVLADSTEAELQSWLVSTGDTVTKGQAIAEIETEKASVELEVEVEGTVVTFTVEAGTSVEVGNPLAVIAAPGDTDDDVARAIESACVDNGGDAATAADDSPSSDPSGGTMTPSANASEGEVDEETGARIFASPLARKIADRSGVDLTDIDGSGPNGRIIRSDVERASRNDGGGSRSSTESTDSAVPATSGNERSQLSNTTGPDSVSTASAMDGDFTAEPVTGMRKIIAQRLTESKSTVPHFYVSMDARIDDLLNLRCSINDEFEATQSKISVNDLILKALGNALRLVPEANAVWNEDSIRHFKSVNVGVAIAIEGGLVTPVVNKVDTRTVTSVSSAVTDLRARAGSKKLRQNELEGGSFSLTNLGMYGVKGFSAIINPPQAGILAVGVGEQRAIVVDGELTVGTMLTCTLSADHRVIDGAVAAKLLAAVKEQLETPTRILM